MPGHPGDGQDLLDLLLTTIPYFCYDSKDMKRLFFPSPNNGHLPNKVRFYESRCTKVDGEELPCNLEFCGLRLKRLLVRGIITVLRPGAINRRTQ